MDFIPIKHAYGGKINMISVVYTNQKYKDVYDIFIKEYKKFNKIDIFKISNCDADSIYDPQEPYYKHWVNALKKIKQDYFIYHQEDFILYNQVNEEKLNFCKSFLENNKQYSFIRLIKSGENLGNKMICENIYEIARDSFPLYSMQATIWKKDVFIQLYEEAQQNKWFECEEYEKACFKLGIQGLYYYNNENKRGMNHCDSSIYPYIATAVVKGKWNLSEYFNELYPLLKENNIDINKRGVF